MSRRGRGNGPKQTPLTGFQKHLIQKFGRGPRCHTMPDPNRRTAAEGDAVGALQKVLEASGQSAEQASQNAQRAVARALKPEKPRPETTPSPGLSLEERRQIIRDASPSEFQKLLSSYGVSPTVETLQRKNPDQQSSAERLLEERGNAAAAARKKSLESLPPFNAMERTVEEVRARIRCYPELASLVDPTNDGLVPHERMRPLTPDSKGKGERVFGRNFQQLQEENLAVELKLRAKQQAQRAADEKRIAALAGTGYAGSWPAMR